MAKIKMQNVRLSFPSLFNTATFGSEDTGKFEATFILDKQKHKKEIDQINAQIQTLVKEKFKGKAIPDDKLCLKDGDEADRPEFEGAFTIKASTKRRPLIIDTDKAPLVEADGKPYAGCYVNAIVSLWAQDNQYGKRINAQLDGVQFAGDGEPFGEGGISEDAFDAFDAFDDDEI